jgi:putative nucleotidyltransferase with HDIG domain
MERGGISLSDTPIATSPKQRAADVSSRNEESYSPLQLCFTKGRGRVFKRLLDMDPEILWLGLSQLPQAKQKEFLARLPFDSPVAPVLEERINAQPRAISDRAAEQHFEAIIHQMELEESLEERSKTQQEVISKLNRVEALPTLPSVAAHVFKIASNANSSATDLTEVIVNDPSLTSKLLKMVNSAFYGFPQKIGTVRQAVVILGTDEIMDLAFGLAAAKVFEVRPLEGLYDPKALWHHSMSTALIAQNVSQRFPEYQRLGAFTAGLLHDFGKIFLIEHFPELYGQLHVNARELGLPLFELEEESFGLNHAAIGELLASNWNLPEALVEAIAFHHQPFSAPGHPQLAAMIGLADYLHHKAGGLGEGPEETPFLSPQLTFGHWSFLTELFDGLDTEQLGKMQEDALAIIKDSQDLFSILD